MQALQFFRQQLSLVVILLTGLIGAEMAMAQDAPSDVLSITLTEYVDREAGVTFSVPEGAEVFFPDSDRDLDNAFLQNGLIFSRIAWGEMFVQIDIVDIEFDLRPDDWLAAYTFLTDRTVTGLWMVMNTQGTPMGVTKVQGADGASNVYFFVIENKGFLISGNGPAANYLVDLVAGLFSSTEAPRDVIDLTKTFTFLETEMHIKEGFTIHANTESMESELILTSAKTVAESSIILGLYEISHDDHNRDIERILAILNKLELTPIEASEVELNNTVLVATNSAGAKFYCSIQSIPGKALVVVISPTTSEDANAWLSGRYYFLSFINKLR